MPAPHLSWISALGLLALLPWIPTTRDVHQDVTQPALRPPVTFSAMGDVPYTAADDELLPRQIETVPETSEFLVHLGDIKSGSTPCDEAVYAKVSGMLATSKVPVFIVPGDNEWNDCADPGQAWQRWGHYFRRFDERWTGRRAVFRQLEREDNFAFVQRHVLFVGVTLVGGRVHDAAEWRRRHADDLEWVRRTVGRFGGDVSALVLLGHANPSRNHDDFFGPFTAEARTFGKPVLYLHGDGHRWLHDRPFDAPNILRVQVDQGKNAPPVSIRVGDDPVNPFLFDRRLDGR